MGEPVSRPLIDPDGWDWDGQRANLTAALAEIGQQTRLVEGQPVVVVFLLVPKVPGAMPQELMAALKAAGYPARIREADGQNPKAVAITRDLDFTEAEIWEVDETTSRIALPYGFGPHGWLLTG